LFLQQLQQTIKCYQIHLLAFARDVLTANAVTQSLTVLLLISMHISPYKNLSSILVENRYKLVAEQQMKRLLKGSGSKSRSNLQKCFINFVSALKLNPWEEGTRAGN
jgi:hypothetical protein